MVPKRFSVLLSPSLCHKPAVRLIGGASSLCSSPLAERLVQVTLNDLASLRTEDRSSPATTAPQLSGRSSSCSARACFARIVRPRIAGGAKGSYCRRRKRNPAGRIFSTRISCELLDLKSGDWTRARAGQATIRSTSYRVSRMQREKLFLWTLVGRLASSFCLPPLCATSITCTIARAPAGFDLCELGVQSSRAAGGPRPRFRSRRRPAIRTFCRPRPTADPSSPQWYYHTHQTVPSLASIARMIQTMLYGKRFFPYYAYVIRQSPLPSRRGPSLTPLTVGGIDRDGTGAVYSFDPVGSYERESCRAAGAAQSLVQPFLDNMVRPSSPPPLSSLRTHAPRAGLLEEPGSRPGGPCLASWRAARHPAGRRAGTRDGCVYGRDGATYRSGRWARDGASVPRFGVGVGMLRPFPQFVVEKGNGVRIISLRRSFRFF